MENEKKCSVDDKKRTEKKEQTLFSHLNPFLEFGVLA